MSIYICLHCGKGFQTNDNHEFEIVKDNLEILDCPFCRNAAFQCKNRAEYNDIKNRVERNTCNTIVIEDFRTQRLNRSLTEVYSGGNND